MAKNHEHEAGNALPYGDRARGIFLNQGPVIFFNQDPIDPDHSFNHDRDRSEKISINVWLKIKNQSLLKKFQIGFDDQKLNTCALLDKSASRRAIAQVHHFSIRVCLKFSIRV
jgi:hypothetical protein